MDDLSFQLAINLQLEDIASIIASRKGKGRARDGITSSDAAFNDYREYLERTVQLLHDERLAESLDRAVREDANEILEIRKTELSDERSRKFAFQLAGVQDPSLDMNKKDHKWRDLAVGSDIDATDSSAEQWEKACFDQWDVIESQNTGGPSATISARRRNTTKCASCLELFPKKETVNVACAHIYCYDCLKQLFINACKDEQLFPPRCCKREIHIDIVFPLLSNEEAVEYLDKAEEYTCDDRTYCFQPSCSKFISPDNITCSVASCLNCYFETCTLCKKEQHIGDCPEDPSMQLTLEVAAENGWQRCQKCHAIIEITHGCQHMICRCKAEWCYRCGLEWKTCSCSDWDVDRLNRRAEDLAIRGAGADANARVLAGRIQEMMNNLREQHECEHVAGWEYERGGAACEMCSDFLPHHIFVCTGCQMRACNRCRMNRI